ncbi:MAG: HEPN domain-containing protein [Cyanobium sp. M30B3]|nr:MAG: HEPN domain-containing protein [Cyanobium sp. M30B3]
MAGAASGRQAIKVLLAADDRDLRSHSLSALLRELGVEQAERWQRQARVLDKLYAPTRYPDALGDDLPAVVFGPEDATAALQAAAAQLSWFGEALEVSDGF